MAKKKTDKPKKTSKSDALRATREANAGGGRKKKGDGIPADAPASAHRPTKRQPELAGFERKTDDELDALGISYDEQSDVMSAAQKQCTDLKKKIAERMSALGIKLYRYHDGEKTREIRFKPEQLEIVQVKEKVTEV